MKKDIKNKYYRDFILSYDNITRGRGYFYGGTNSDIFVKKGNEIFVKKTKIVMKRKKDMNFDELKYVRDRNLIGYLPSRLNNEEIALIEKVFHAVLKKVIVSITYTIHNSYPSNTEKKVVKTEQINITNKLFNGISYGYYDIIRTINKLSTINNNWSLQNILRKEIAENEGAKSQNITISNIAIVGGIKDMFDKIDDNLSEYRMKSSESYIKKLPVPSRLVRLIKVEEGKEYSYSEMLRSFDKIPNKDIKIPMFLNREKFERDINNKKLERKKVKSSIRKEYIS